MTSSAYIKILEEIEIKGKSKINRVNNGERF